MLRDLRAAAGRVSGHGPVKMRCPFHPDETPSLAVYPTHGWCFGGCGYITSDRLLAAFSRDADSLPEFTGDLPAAGKRRGTQDRGYVPPSATLVDLWHDTLTRGPRKDRLQWLIDRGIGHAAIRQARLGHDGTHFTIPVFAGKRVIGVKKRRDDLYCSPDEMRYTAPYGQPALLYRPQPGRGPVIVCEGELDALTVSQYGYDGLTTTAGSTHLPNILRRASLGSGPLLVAADMDSAGNAAYEGIREAVGHSARRLVWPHGKDVSEALLYFPEGRRGAALRLWIAKAKEGNECQ